MSTVYLNDWIAIYFFLCKVVLIKKCMVLQLSVRDKTSLHVLVFVQHWRVFYMSFDSEILYRIIYRCIYGRLFIKTFVCF